ncbi:hypothetical protein Nepgr_012189 [Nepenthes gracilis]|uniref:Pentatricopeptide repeat-containing protein n=1 Tax=Nepenthes gracilis TaxID=150966 RepID=A0AAD3XMU3_NEPGR|nr:hypothetical protein Nepgr_012189 [Nepenthes gracilis]
MAARASLARHAGSNLNPLRNHRRVLHKALNSTSYSSHFCSRELHGVFQFQNPRFLSNSSIELEPEDSHRHHLHESGMTSTDSPDIGQNAALVESPDVSSSGPEELPLVFGETSGSNDTQMESLSSIEQLVDGHERANEIDIEKLEYLLSLLQSTVDGSLESTLDSMDLTLHEEFVVRVLETPLVPGNHLLRFFKWALIKTEFTVTPTAVHALVVAISNDLKRKDAYALWDLIKVIGEKNNGVLNAEILNDLISLLSRLGKAKAAFEIFGKFEEFGCVPNAETYYFAINVLCRRSMYHWAWSLCEKMLNAGIVPESEKIGEIISLFCKGYKAKEAHLLYLSAKENSRHPPQIAINHLIATLSKVDETVHLALEMLDDFSGESRKSAINPFSSVVRGLCRINDINGAKVLLSKMIEVGPPPGNAVFNPIISSLSKAGDMGDAMEILRLMEKRGLKPDVYTYSVIMSGYAKGGLMDEACNVLSEAKKFHSKLCPATYHTLIRGFCKLAEYEKALNLLSEMEDYGVRPNVDEYNKLIQSLCLQALDWKTAEKLLGKMREKGLHLPGISRGLIQAVKELEEEAVRTLVVNNES